MDYREKFNMWLEYEGLLEELKNELLNIKDNDSEIKERFFCDLEFGTGGMRGIMGAGTARMNIYTVRRTTAGLARYINAVGDKDRSVVIAFDSRHNSKIFATEAARVLAAEGVCAYLFEDLRPTPELSFAVRHLGCSAGIVVTASHNPSMYNGYKVYGPDGAQVIADAADEIIKHIEKIHIFNDVPVMDVAEAVSRGLIRYIGSEVDEAFYKKVMEQSINRDVIARAAKDFKVVYTPFHGAGNVPVREVLKRMGMELIVVPEQEKPDGDFPTVKSPNPEDKEGFELAIELAKKVNANLIIGTDPDSDRIGVLVKRGDEFFVLTGNQTGVLLTEYMLSQKKQNDTMPQNPVVIKTVVTTEMAREITDNYDVELIDVLTGFKFIAEKIREFEMKGDRNYIFGFEESYGYLPGTYVRDKDAVGAAMLVVEMAAWYHLRGMTLYEGLEELYKKYGRYGEWIKNIYFEGVLGMEKIGKVMDSMRDNIPASIGGSKVVAYSDFRIGKRFDLVKKTESPVDLPKSNVLRFETEDKSFVAFRPSGTEPKFKIYAGFLENDGDSDRKVQAIERDVMRLMGE